VTVPLADSTPGDREPQVLITGASAVTAAGPTAGAAWESVLAGRSGIGPIRQWDASGWPCGIAGEIPDFDPRALVPDRKLHKLLSRMDLLGLKAVHDAVAEAGLLVYREVLTEEQRGLFNERTALVVASGGANYRNQYDYFPLLTRSQGDMKVFGAELLSCVSPMWLLRTLPNNVLCYAGVQTGFKGPNANFTSHSASGALAILEAARMIRCGEADRAVVVGYDAPVEPQAVLFYSGLGILSAASLRPFDARRDGSILGEGAAALVLETPESARRRGARPRGMILGGAVASEGEGLLPLRDDGDGVLRALQGALASSGLEPRDVHLVTAHGNGTPRSDASEGRAILRCFGTGSRGTPSVTAFKWAIGHLLAASGMVEAVLTLKALGEGVAPGIAPLERLDPELAGLGAAREHHPLEGGPARTGLVICRGFGGLAGAVVLRAIGS